jgi:hypothetical protein
MNTYSGFAVFSVLRLCGFGLCGFAVFSVLRLCGFGLCGFGGFGGFYIGLIAAYAVLKMLNSFLIYFRDVLSFYNDIRM